jgi:hypothetical protein
MGIDAKIVGSDGRSPIISEFGELVTGNVSFSTPSVQEMGAASTGYVFIPPSQGKSIVITSIYAFANRNVSATIEADVEIYTSTTGSGTTVNTSILQAGIPKQSTLILPMNSIVSEGLWVMGKTSDDDVKVSVYYYYI